MTRLLLVTSVCVSQLIACAHESPFVQADYTPTLPQSHTVENRVDGSIYSAANNRFLFEDIKARRPGDVITVLLDESTNATKSASTNTSKNTSIGMPTPTLFGMTPSFKGKELLNNDVGSDIAFAGGADSMQSNKLKGHITVTIADVYENGNLLVRGEKILTLNQGSEVVRISGIVRPADIDPDNSVKSTLIANARITYSGKGVLADSNAPGWLTHFLGSSLWPF